jgi:hypothetical protein
MLTASAAPQSGPRFFLSGGRRSERGPAEPGAGSARACRGVASVLAGYSERF